jgi:hypothetical protein
LQELEVVLSLEETVEQGQVNPTSEELKGKIEEPRCFKEESTKQEEKAPSVEEIVFGSMSRGDPPPDRFSTAQGFAMPINVKPLASRRGFCKDAEGRVNPDLWEDTEGQVNPDPLDDKQGQLNPDPLDDKQGRLNPDPLEDKQGRFNLDPVNAEPLKGEEVLLEGSKAEGRMEDEEGQPQAGASITGPREDSDCLSNLDLRSELDSKHVGDVGYKWMDWLIDYFIVRNDLRFRGILCHKKGDHISLIHGKEIMMDPLYSYQEGDLRPVYIQVERQEDIEPTSSDIQKLLGPVVINEFGSKLCSLENKTV